MLGRPVFFFNLGASRHADWNGNLRENGQLHSESMSKPRLDWLNGFRGSRISEFLPLRRVVLLLRSEYCRDPEAKHRLLTK